MDFIQSVDFSSCRHIGLGAVIGSVVVNNNKEKSVICENPAKEFKKQNISIQCVLQIHCYVVIFQFIKEPFVKKNET